MIACFEDDNFNIKDQDCYELSAEYERKHKTEKLEELGNMLTGLDAGDSIVIAKSFSHMLNLANLAEEVQIAYRRRIKLLKMGDFADENSAITESDIEETFKRLVTELKKSPQEVFDALKEQTVDLVLTAHPTQSVRRSLLQKHGRFVTELRNNYSPLTTNLSFQFTRIWKSLTSLNIGINERVPYNAPLIQFSSWMGGDRDGNPRVTPEVTRDVCLLARMMAANLYFSQIEDLMFEALKA
ncbi:hypothetical protein Ahy_A09g042565 [Arachis hypogaea]|uniref:Phosphoenolpyruvate carboxylase n=1 Tax=Arachis hypogaea TaxID=3818 RepID=A0A445BG88_ARAHY|nr:hypothetical protein Ahy_A09g042565 [Arachis hypogaea]